MESYTGRSWAARCSSDDANQQGSRLSGSLLKSLIFTLSSHHALRITPRKLLQSLTYDNNGMTSAVIQNLQSPHHQHQTSCPLLRSLQFEARSTDRRDLRCTVRVACVSCGGFACICASQVAGQSERVEVGLE